MSTFFFEKKVAKKQKSLQDLSALSVQIKAQKSAPLPTVILLASRKIPWNREAR